MRNIKSVCIVLIVFSMMSAEIKPVSVVINGISATVTASSELSSKTGAYSVKNVFDEDSVTAWVEGKPGKGIDEYIEIVFSKEVTVYALSIKPGYIKNEKTYLENIVPFTINLSTEKEVLGNFSFNFNTEYNVTPTKYGAKFCTQNASLLNRNTNRILILNTPKRLEKLRLTITGVLDGETRYSDLCITEFKPILNQDDSLVALIRSLLKENSSVECVSGFTNLDTVSLEKDFNITPESPMISFAQVVRKKINRPSITTIYDTVFLSKPRNIPRLSNKCEGSNCFLTAVFPGFVNSFITIFKNDEHTYLIGDWTVKYQIESDFSALMARFPVLVVRENKITSGFEIPVLLAEGECSHAPDLQQILKNTRN